MPDLTNKTLAQLYTIPATDWEVINKRVGIVIEAQSIQSYISAYLPDYPTLLNLCQLWTQTTFTGLKAQSTAISNYSTKAITNFSKLNNSIKQIGDQSGTVPANIKEQTKNLLDELACDTKTLSGVVSTLLTQVRNFLTHNEIVDSQIAKHKDKLGDFWPNVSKYISDFESATGLVMGEWQAISNDLSTVVSSPIDVTMPFLESLSLDVALTTWQSISVETSAFPSNVAGQEKYWKNPIQKAVL